MDGTSQDYRISFFYLLIVGKQVILKLAYLWLCTQPNATLTGGVVKISEFDKFGLMAGLFHDRLDHSIHIGIVAHNTSAEPNNLHYLPPSSKNILDCHFRRNVLPAKLVPTVYDHHLAMSRARRYG
jgi:hypothetical protein